MVDLNENQTARAWIAPRGIGTTAWTSDPKKQTQIRRRFALHGAFMFRSYALTLSAITLRAYTYLIDLTLLPITPREIYILTAWLSWVPNLLFAEWLVRRGWVGKVYG